MAYKFQIGDAIYSGSITVSNDLSASTLQATDVTTSPNSLIVGTTTISETDVTAVAGVTPGTASAGKNLVVNNLLDISNINTGSFNHIVVGSMEVSALEVTSIISETIQSVASNSTLDLSQGTIILADASSSSITLTLPNALGAYGKLIKLKRKDDSSNQVNIAPQTGEKIEGTVNQTISLDSAYAAVTLFSNGTEYYVI